ncbi:unnamed protein product [Calypogeia fissa]
MSGYDISAEREEARLNPRRKAMEDYGVRPDVHDLLLRFMTDLLTTQPPDPVGYMYKWAIDEKSEPKWKPPPIELKQPPPKSPTKPFASPSSKRPQPVKDCTATIHS